MEKKIQVPTTPRKFFRQYLELINPLVNLRGKELDVLSELLYHNHKMQKVPEEYRWKVLFNYDTKTNIREKLNLSVASMNNNMSSLRSKGIIINGKIKKDFLIHPKGQCDIIFSFKINESRDKNTL